MRIGQLQWPHDYVIRTARFGVEVYRPIAGIKAAGGALAPTPKVTQVRDVVGALVRICYHVHQTGQIWFVNVAIQDKPKCIKLLVGSFLPLQQTSKEIHSYPVPPCIETRSAIVEPDWHEDCELRIWYLRRAVAAANCQVALSHTDPMFTEPLVCEVFQVPGLPRRQWHWANLDAVNDGGPEQK